MNREQQQHFRIHYTEKRDIIIFIVNLHVLFRFAWELKLMFHSAVNLRQIFRLRIESISRFCEA